MNKKLLLIWLIALFFLSCVKDGSYDSTKESNQDKLGKAELFSTTEQYQVPVVDGYVTSVSCNGMLLARTSTPMSINIPKNAATKSGNGLLITYSPGKAAQPFSNLWQVILFEDSSNGDFDYNDIVLQANYQVVGDRLSVKVHPIALGSNKLIKIGYVWSQNGDSGEVIVSTNSREELFQGEAGFLNTRSYDLHYSSFTKETSVKLANATDAVDITWFIVVDNNLKFFAVNQTGKKCIDDKGMPYGLALTNVGENGASLNPIATSQSKTGDYTEWLDIKPDIVNWAFMPALPAVPSDAKKITEESQLWNAKAQNYVLNEGESFAEWVGFTGSNQTIYVKGTLTLTNVYDKYKIVIMPGGRLQIPEVTTIQNITIHNYGAIEFTGTNSGGKQLNLGDKTEFKTNQDFLFPEMSIQIDKATLYVAGKVHVADLEVVGSAAKAYASALTSNGRLELSRNSLLYVSGAANVESFKLNSNAHMYSDCSLQVEGVLSVTDNSELDVKSYISAQSIDMTSSCMINIMSGALIESQRLSSSNAPSSSINVVGSDIAAVVTDEFNIDGGLRLDKFLTGKMGMIFNVLKNGNYEINLDNTQITLPGSNVVFNSDKITVPKNGCSPGYNAVNPTDNGFSWFAYPMENVYIGDCYDFESWKRGEFNFTKLSGAKVFDIFNKSPRKGGNYEVFRIVE